MLKPVSQPAVKMLPGEFVFPFSPQFLPFIFGFLFRVLILLCLPIPVPFHSHAHPLLPSFTHSIFFSASALIGPRFPPLTLFTTLRLLTPHLPFSIHKCRLTFFFFLTPTTSSIPRLRYFHRQITQKCSVIVPMSAVFLSLWLAPPASEAFLSAPLLKKCLG